MQDPTKRFSDRVEDYVKYRPEYPDEIYGFLKKETGIDEGSVIADIGSGTGISSLLFLKNGHKVIGVEPNDEMRKAAEDYLSSHENFVSLNGKAEETGLDNKSVDIIIAGQAFHWFDVEKAKQEFKRVLNPDGYVILFWNERLSEGDEFLSQYDLLIKKYSDEYETVKHRNIDEKIFKKFFNEYKIKFFENSQSFDFDGLKGRLLSSSYTPKDGEKYDAMIVELGLLFDRFHKNGQVKILYKTGIYYGRL